MNMGLYLALLVPEIQLCPEADILGKPRLHKPGGQKSPGGTNNRVRDPVKRQEQLLAENHGDEGSGGARGHIAEDGGLEEWNRDKGEGRVGQHGLYGRAGGLNGRKGGKI